MLNIHKIFIIYHLSLIHVHEQLPPCSIYIFHVACIFEVIYSYIYRDASHPPVICQPVNLESPKDLPHIEAAEVTETADTSKSLDFAVPAVKVPASFWQIWTVTSRN